MDIQNSPRDGLAKRTLSVLEGTASKTTQNEEGENRTKSSKTTTEVNPAENFKKNLQSFLGIICEQKQVPN